MFDLGVIDLVLDNASGAWKVSDSRAEIRPITDRATRKALVAADPMVAETIGAEHAGTLAHITRVSDSCCVTPVTGPQ